MYVSIVRTFAEEDRDVVGAEIASGLDADEERRAATSGHQLSGEFGRLEGQGKGPFLQPILIIIAGCNFFLQTIAIFQINVLSQHV